MKVHFPDGVWPVMLTPFTKEGEIDYASLGKAVHWYEQGGSDGLFAVCQSSEMFFLSEDERVALARFVKARSKLPVVASGHISDRLEDQVRELSRMAETGVDALILISNRLAKEGESDEVLLQNLGELMRALPSDLPLGFYECPYPYKRLLSPLVIRFMLDSGRFYFIKDTSCQVENIREKLKWVAGSTIKLYNANTATLLETMKLGAAGYSGVMANFHPELYRWLLDHYQEFPDRAESLQQALTLCSLIENRAYPRCAKYMQQLCGNGFTLETRNPAAGEMLPVMYEEVRQLARYGEALLHQLPKKCS